MNWDDLKYFLALSREGSMSAAGRVLGVKHTTVARRIKALEFDMATRLFDHTPSGYVMTQAAENIFEQAESVEDKVRSIDRRASNSDSKLAGPLKLTIAFQLANRLIIPRIGKFKQTYPGIDLQLLMTKGLVDLGALQADLAIRMTANPPDYLVGRELMKLRHGIYASKELLESKANDSPVILFTSESTSPDWVTQYFTKSEVAYRIDDVGSMAIAAESGAGFAKLPCFIGDTQPGLFRLDCTLPTSNWGIWMLNHIDLRATARVRVCKDYLQGVIESQRGLIEGEGSRYL